MVKRHFIETIFVDDLEDEVMLVKKLDELIQIIQTNKERIVCIVCSEDRNVVHILKRGNDEQKK